MNEQGIARLQERLPPDLPVRLLVSTPHGFVVTLDVAKRRDALACWQAFEPLPLTVVRHGNTTQIKPAELVSRHDEDNAWLNDAIYPAYWQHRVDGTQMLIWWAGISLGENEGSRKLVKVEAHIRNDPAWLAPRHKMGGPRNETILAYQWKPRDYPLGEVVADLSDVKDKPGRRLVWFPSDGPAVGVALGCSNA